MFALADRLRPFLLFGLSVAFGRGLSLVSIPLIAHHLSPEDYGRFELVSSVVECAGLIATFGLADTLYRFAAGVDEEERRRVMRGLSGCAVVIALTLAAICELAIGFAMPLQADAQVSAALSIGVAGAAAAGAMELCLAWLRLMNRPGLYLALSGLRGLAQVSIMALTLSHGYGFAGILAGNAAVDGAIVAVLLAAQYRETGIGFDRQAIGRTFRYGLPLLGGALCTFVLGSFDRWFLASHVVPGEIAFYALAGKLSLVVALAMTPFGMWWYPQRLGLLRTLDGRERSARMIALATSLLGAVALLVVSGAPVFIDLLLPPAYAESLRWLPFLVVIVCLNELSSLLNAGVYATTHGMRVLAINGCAASVAALGYLLAIPALGVKGAITATLAGQGVRLALFIVYGQRLAPIRYRWDVLIVAVCVNIAAFSGVQFVAQAGARLAIVTTALGLMAVVAWRQAVGRKTVLRGAIA